VDVGPQVFKLISVFRAPNATQEFHVGNKSALIPEQTGKKIELLGRQVDLFVRLPEQMPIEVHCQIPGVQDRLGMWPASARGF
jgi:hypothetical protein